MAKKFPTTLPDFYLTPLHVRLLKIAKDRLKGGQNRYICIALGDAALTEPEGKKREKAKNAVHDLKRYVRRAIKGEAYFHDWQSAKGLDRDYEQSCKDRVKWIKYILTFTPEHY